MRAIALLVLVSYCTAAPMAATGDSAGGAADTDKPISNGPPHGVTQFDLHDPDLMANWAYFLETTPMQNSLPLPSALRDRLTKVVAVYRSLTPADEPAFFVATYFDVLSRRLLVAGPEEAHEILPLRTCPVFASRAGASVSSLLAVASGLPGELFANAPGRPGHYRYLILQTEYSHCRFLASLRTEAAARVPVHEQHDEDAGVVRFSFVVGSRKRAACLTTKEELRAVLETVGDVEATSRFRGTTFGRPRADEAEILAFARLLALLATDGKNGYAAIPVLYPLLDGDADGVDDAEAACLPVADALQLAYRARAVFRRVVPFAVRDNESLLMAKLAVMQALSEADGGAASDARLTGLLNRFVSGADLLLAPTVAYEKMPPVND